MGTISSAIGAFVDMESFSVAGSPRLNGSLPASMSAWKKVKHFSVRDTHFDGALPTLNYRAMTHCDICGVGEPIERCGAEFAAGRGNYFSSGVYHLFEPYPSC